MKLSTIIVDDESLSRQRLLNLLNEINEIEVVAICSTGKSGIENINEHNPNLILLDIKLKDMNGFDIIELMKPSKKPLIIFISAYDRFALKAFDYFAFDYLLKPFKDERFYTSINKAIDYTKNHDLTDIENKLNNLINFIKINQTPIEASENTISYKLPIKLGNKVSFLNTNNINYILASGYYAEIHTKDKKHLLRESLSSLLTKLDTSQFIRIHRSTIININCIEELVHSNYGEIDIKTKDNKFLRISKSYKKDFFKVMGI